MGLPKKLKELIPYYSYRVHWSDEDDAFVVHVDELKGCATHGSTMEEAMNMAFEAVEGHLEVIHEQGQGIPEPIARIKANGKILIRATPELHQKLLQKSHADGKSLNALVVEKLAEIVA